MMSVKERLKRYIDAKREQIERGRQVTLQMKAERQRKKLRKFMDMKPGARKAITEGMMSKSSPLDVMKNEYKRRKYERKNKTR